MVLAAAKSGCECIKHQTHFVEDEMTEEAKKFFHLMQIFLFEVMSKNSLSKNDEVELKNFTEELGLILSQHHFKKKLQIF